MEGHIYNSIYNWKDRAGFFPYSKYIHCAQKMQVQGGENEDGQISRMTSVDSILIFFYYFFLNNEVS